MRITRVSVHQLFGMFDHDIELNQEDRITIIHGPNGVGKTTVLKLIAALFSQRYQTLQSTPFSSMTVYMRDKRRSTLTIWRTVGKERGEVDLRFRYREGSIEKKSSLGPIKEDIHRASALRMIDEYVPFLERVGQRRWVDQRFDEVLSLEEVVRRHGDELPREITSFAYKVPDWLEKLIASVHTHFIQTQRLLVTPPLEPERPRRHRARTRTTVERYAELMSLQIQERLRESGALAASLDRTFPRRLIEKALSREVTEEVVRNEYNRQSEYRNRLMQAGLIEPEEQVPLPEGKMRANDRKVLWHYLTDISKKFKVFDTLLQRVELLKDIINKRFLFKAMTVDKTQGFLFQTGQGHPLPLHSLSSGEQHELVLTFELLFRVREQSLILIDEPELSLHVTWQHKFLEDIERISALANLDFLVATHSPSIIHNRRDLMVALGDH